MNRRWAKILAAVVLALSLLVTVAATAAGIVMTEYGVYEDRGIYFREEFAKAIFYEEISTARDYTFRLHIGNLTAQQKNSYEARLSRENCNLAIEVVRNFDLTTVFENYPSGAYQYKFETILQDGNERFIITAYLQEELSAKDMFSTWLPAADLLIACADVMIWIAIVGGVLAIVCLILLMCAAGHRRGTDGITLSWIDRVPLEIVAGAYFLLLMLSLQIVDPFLHEDVLTAIAIAVFAIVWTVLAVVALLTLAVRTKSHTLFTNTLTWRLLKLVWRGVKLTARVLAKLPLYWKTALGFICFSFFEFLALAIGYPHITLFWILTRPCIIAFLIYAVLMMRRLQKAGEQLAAGNTTYKVSTSYMPSDFRRHGENLNNLSIGLNRAVEERMRSERIKAELITNVSHDIKTPLTSIINYVDLLQTGGLDSPDASEYLEVLAQQSDRLKKLTEDLIEASKAASGCVTVHAEPTDVNVLLSQALGEYEERLRAAGVEPILQLTDACPTVMADGRLLWRVFDNLFSNIRKYAQHDTRAYFTSSVEDGCAEITFRNISAEQIGVSAEDLSERFVRGDASRHTEGSGLGLSIARSLTELQGGTFRIDIDGDLFKVTVIFPIM